jgi:DNA-binding MarR family transcriptional regulator
MIGVVTTTLKLPCYCASWRQATRAISQTYDRALRPVNLTITQFTILMVLNFRPGARVNDLAEALAVDQTTLSRTLALMNRSELIEREDGGDRRERRWVLTRIGREKLRRGTPLWNKAQKKVEAILGKPESERAMTIAFQLAKGLAP